MALDIIKQITDIEREGDEIIKKSQEEALQILKESNEKAESILDEASKKSLEDYNNVISKYEKEAELDSKPIIEESNTTINALNNISQDLLDKAVNLVIERIVNSHGNS